MIRDVVQILIALHTGVLNFNINMNTIPSIPVWRICITSFFSACRKRFGLVGD